MTDLLDYLMEKQREAIADQLARAPRDLKPGWRAAHVAHVAAQLAHESSAPVRQK